jgi:predicted RNase H-like HicB family nuclease
MKQQAITFIVTEDVADGGFVAYAHWPDGNRDIHTQADDHDELVRNIRDAIEATFDDAEEKPELVHLHYVRDETFPLSTVGDSDNSRYPLRGKPYRFEDPYSPVGMEDWEALK